jgi:Fe-S-cluster containining protein
MTSEGLRQFFGENPILYGTAPMEDKAQLSRIYEQYPDSVRLLSDREAVKLDRFECQRCGACCASIKYITVCFSDVERWVAQKRPDILDALDIDRTATPMLAMCGRDAIAMAKAGADKMLQGLDVPDRERVREILYITKLLESAVYVSRKNNACAFLEKKNGLYTCKIHDTKPRVCDKFPYYIGHFTDSRLLKEDSFCPALREVAREKGLSN